MSHTLQEVSRELGELLWRLRPKSVQQAAALLHLGGVSHVTAVPADALTESTFSNDSRITPPPTPTPTPSPTAAAQSDAAPHGSSPREEPQPLHEEATLSSSEADSSGNERKQGERRRPSRRRASLTLVGPRPSQLLATLCMTQLHELTAAPPCPWTSGAGRWNSTGLQQAFSLVALQSMARWHPFNLPILLLHSHIPAICHLRPATQSTSSQRLAESGAAPSYTAAQWFAPVGEAWHFAWVWVHKEAQRANLKMKKARGSKVGIPPLSRDAGVEQHSYQQRLMVLALCREVLTVIHRAYTEYKHCLEKEEEEEKDEGGMQLTQLPGFSEGTSPSSSLRDSLAALRHKPLLQELLALNGVLFRFRCGGVVPAMVYVELRTHAAAFCDSIASKLAACTAWGLGRATDAEPLLPPNALAVALWGSFPPRGKRRTVTEIADEGDSDEGYQGYGAEHGRTPDVARAAAKRSRTPAKKTFDDVISSCAMPWLELIHACFASVLLNQQGEGQEVEYPQSSGNGDGTDTIAAPEVSVYRDCTLSPHQAALWLHTILSAVDKCYSNGTNDGELVESLQRLLLSSLHLSSPVTAFPCWPLPNPLPPGERECVVVARPLPPSPAEQAAFLQGSAHFAITLNRDDSYWRRVGEAMHAVASHGAAATTPFEPHNRAVSLVQALAECALRWHCIGANVELQQVAHPPWLHTLSFAVAHCCMAMMEAPVAVVEGLEAFNREGGGHMFYESLQRCNGMAESLFNSR